jgi:molybdopterin-guanine dinucleotide biosynthesis protein A
LNAVPNSAGGAVLCGGASTRMGRDKALIEVGGRALAAHVCSVLESAGCLPVVLVGGDGERLVPLTHRPWLADTWPGEGPLGGVIDALRWFRRRGVAGVVIAACDLPGLTTEAVRAVAGWSGATVAVGDRLHPSLAYWPVAATARLEQLFATGVRSLHEALATVDATPVAVAEAAMHNANRPDDLVD